MKKVYLISTQFLVMISLLILSCREEFDPEFREVPIINNPPELTEPVEDQEFSLADGMAEIEMAAFVSDPEGDPVAYIVSGNDESVVTVQVQGSRLIFTLVGLGIATISFTGTDGNEGNEVSGSFQVTVVE